MYWNLKQDICQNHILDLLILLKYWYEYMILLYLSWFWLLKLGVVVSISQAQVFKTIRDINWSEFSVHCWHNNHPVWQTVIIIPSPDLAFSHQIIWKIVKIIWTSQLTKLEISTQNQQSDVRLLAPPTLSWWWILCWSLDKGACGSNSSKERHI